MSYDQNNVRLKEGDRVVYTMGGKRPKLVLGVVTNASGWYDQKIKVRRSVIGHVRPSQVIKVDV